MFHVLAAVMTPIMLYYSDVNSVATLFLIIIYVMAVLMLAACIRDGPENRSCPPYTNTMSTSVTAVTRAELTIRGPHTNVRRGPNRPIVWDTGS